MYSTTYWYIMGSVCMHTSACSVGECIPTNESRVACGDDAADNALEERVQGK